jgi:hypothetical protein
MSTNKDKPKQLWELSRNELLNKIHDEPGLSLFCNNEDDFKFWKSLIKKHFPMLEIQNRHCSYPLKLRIKSTGWTILNGENGPRSNYYGNYGGYIYETIKSYIPQRVSCNIEEWDEQNRLAKTKDQYAWLRYRVEICQILGELTPKDLSFKKSESAKNNIESYKNELLEGL